MFRTAVLVVFLLGAVVPSGAAAGTSGEPEIVALYPNPVHGEDAGEFVVVQFPEPTNVSGWTVSDGESAATLPNRTLRGSVAFSTDSAVVRGMTDHRVFPFAGTLSLANGGETVRLQDGARTVDAATYADAPEGEVLRRRGDGRFWEPLGATDLEPVRADAARARTFVLPDRPAVPLAVLRSARERILLAGYTFASERTARALRRAAERGVNVTVLVDGAPVGGLSRREAKLLDSLAPSGVDVEVLTGPRARYAFHHAKYAVVDDRSLVLSENWKPSGTGGSGSRGWGVAVESRNVSATLASVYRADAGWRDTVPWRAFRRNETFVAADPANGTYPSRFPSRDVPVDSVDVLVAPDNAERGMLSVLRSADRSIRVQQVSIGGRHQPFLRATLAAARRGVDVRVLLSGEWYVEAENRNLTRWLNRRARREGIPLEARVAEPRSRFEKVHNKGIIVDEERVVVGSLNWNNHSARENREVAVVLNGEEAGAYYARVFRADWRGGRWRLPVGLAGVAAAAALVAARVGRKRVRFER